MIDTHPTHQQPIVVLSSRTWNEGIAERLARVLDRQVEIISSPEQLNPKTIARIDPQWIFVPHWSHLIPQSIWGSWRTVIFHMTDLPYGRGGSPLQNLIQRGHSSTMLTALRCCEGLDTGDIYFKQKLDLHGSAEEIFLRADELIEEMIALIVRGEPKAIPQQGKPVVFTRRTPDQSNLSLCQKGALSAWYDHIRMLDAEGYPHAFLKLNGMRLEFRRVSKSSDGLYADVKIVAIPQSQTNYLDILS